jgi:hypothetical protein
LPAHGKRSKKAEESKIVGAFEELPQLATGKNISFLQVTRRASTMKVATMKYYRCRGNGVYGMDGVSAGAGQRGHQFLPLPRSLRKVLRFHSSIFFSLLDQTPPRRFLGNAIA